MAVLGASVVADEFRAAGSSVASVYDAFDLALGLLDEDANVFDQNVRNIRFATFMGGGLSTLLPRLLLRKTCCNVVGMRDEKPLGSPDEASAAELFPAALVLEFNVGSETLCGCSPTLRFAFRISTAWLLRRLMRA